MATPSAPQPHVFVVLGATGNLMQLKLLPALYRLSVGGKIPTGTVILGAARRPLDDNGFREMATTSLRTAKVGPDDQIRAFCAGTLFYQPLGDETAAGFTSLRERIEELERARHLPGNRILYLALPLEAFGPVVHGLGDAKLNTGPGWTRVVLEKPFGRDFSSARALNQLLRQYFQEQQIYRIDHYLGKETVQNLMVFRFANMFIESLWNRDRVEQVEITVAEQIGVEDRAEYYDTSGALRDMIQNHVTQLLTLVALEPPATRHPDEVRNEKVKVLRSAKRVEPDDVVRGQYIAGTVAGQPVRAYRDEAGIAPNSQTETYVALRMKVDNWRWRGVPFFLRTGKRLPAKATRVVVTFKAPPVSMFQSEEEYEVDPDRISILVQPEEGFELAFEIKVPGREIRVQTHRMKFHYADVFGELSDGYDTLLVEVMLGDPTHFVRADEVEESWRIYQAVLDHPPPLVFYPAGSEGPPEAQQLVEQWGRRWYSD
jgi:glucose-6-phosphate 1-dehydrogenase